jgi:[ribosomal protein S5]-alanine N-acetyltransferase
MPPEADGLVYLRHPAITDRDEFLALRSGSRDWLEPWEPKRPAPELDVLLPQNFARFVMDSNTERRQRFLVIQGGDHRIAGQVALNEIIRGPLQQAFLGYWIARPYAGLGYMTFGIRLAIDHAFRTLGLQRVEANIQPHNLKSIAVVQRLGFRREGFSPRYLEIQGQRADHERWAILADEWARQ